MVNLRLMECINSTEQEKFYEAIPGVVVSPSKDTRDIIYGGNKTERVPHKDAADKMRRRGADGRFIKSRRKKIPPPKRNFNTVIHKNGKRVKICRPHNLSFIGKVTGPLAEIKWDKNSTPNKRFVQRGRHDYVPGVGTCYFGWNKSSNVSNLRIWLPEKYSLPHELEDKVIDKMAWDASRWFSTKYRVGIGLLEVSSESYAFEATKSQKEYFNKYGQISTETAYGKASVDESKEPWVEQEYTNRAEARRVASDLEYPGQIEFVAREGEDVKDWIATFQDNFSKYLELDNKNKILQEKRWSEQTNFNAQVKEFMENSEERNKLSEASKQTLLFKTEQLKLDKYLESDSDISIYG